MVSWSYTVAHSRAESAVGGDAHSVEFFGKGLKEIEVVKLEKVWVR